MCPKITSFLSILLILPFPALAEVVDSSAAGFTMQSSVIITTKQMDVYRAMLDLGEWWDPEHTYSGKSQNLFIEDKAGGCFCEKLENGGSIQHLVVVYTEPGKILRMRGALGPLQSMAVIGSLEFLLTSIEGGTKIQLRYTVGGYYPNGLGRLASVVDNVLTHQLERLKNFVETGKPR